MTKKIGVVFLGVVGAKQRREFTILGDKVNLAARLMQYAKVNKNMGEVIVDSSVKNQIRSRDRVIFGDNQPPIYVKGKKEPITVFAPELTEYKIKEYVPSNEPLLSHTERERNLIEDASVAIAKMKRGVI